MRTVIIGTGPAGITAAEVLRRHDPDADLVLVTTEHEPPYSPPAMADHFLTGRRAGLFWKGEDVCERWGATELRGVQAVSVDTRAHEVALSDGRSLDYDSLLIASGSRLHASLPGNELSGIHDFKSLDAARRILGGVRDGRVRRVLVVGSGFIGVELALLLSDLGVHVTVLGRRGWVMPRVLDPDTAAVAERAIRARGVHLMLGVPASAFVGDETVEGVELADGTTLRADAFVAATGVKPHIEFLHDSDVATDWGVLVDDRMRTTAPDVYAAGDVAEASDRMTGNRYVHAIFPNAVAQATVAALNILDRDTAYAGAESMNSLKHLGIPLVSIGDMEGEDRLQWRSGDALRTVWLTDGRIVGARLAGEISGAGVYRSLMLRRDDVRRFGRRLVEPSFGSGDLALTALMPDLARSARVA
ncbi:NAD(P)/FAD-dependent oxidoreductase [Longivirga aurantiaca]|uniref:NAD(P)/FAD-dependent oxidoreductase n=1 Tax=Longivirga aurantiaca TaxID=1837743 RepID=A0ABW1T0U3_9ACTN